MTSNENRPTRNQQREEARAKAKALREQHKKGERRKRLGLQIGVGAVVIAAVAIVAGAIMSGSNNGGAVSTPTNLIFDGGIKIGAGLQAYTNKFTPTPAPVASATASPTTPPNIVIYLDYQCPICQTFEVPNSSQLKSWVNTGAATLEIHPISFLDGRGSPNEYSSRAANAAICVAEYAPNSYFDFNALLFENQPKEGTAGPSNDDLVADLAKVQINATDKLTSCVKNKSFGQWISDHTSKVLSSPIPGTKQTVDGTPYILVNGQRYTWKTGEELTSPARFAQFVQTAAANNQ
jgi:protein-disulfide isomerase